MTSSCVRSITMTGLMGCLLAGSAFALGLADLTNQEAARGIKGVLSEGASSAIGKLGVPGGFMNNPKVKIPLPPALDEIAQGLRLMGRGKDADELVATMNQAAEQAIPEAKPLLVDAVKTMSVEDAKKILTGGDDSVTQFFRAKTAAPRAVKFLPIVKQAPIGWAWHRNTTSSPDREPNSVSSKGMRQTSSSTSPIRRWMAST